MITQEMFTEEYGAAVYAGNASVLIGAGLSRAAGLPDWNSLMNPLRERAGIPADEHDLPLVAEYFQNALPGGRQILEAELAARLTSPGARPTVGFALLARLPVQTIWTTNYDTLLEEAVPEASVMVRDADLKERSVNARRIVKMHGSLSSGGAWDSPPVISRRDYEEYERRHPRIWADLRATYLTKAMLFLGFSFDDPNIEVLLRLVRTTLDLGAPEHFTILRRPPPGAELMAHDHRVRDLERSGVAVLEIEDFGDLVGILASLVRRTRPLSLFIAGSGTDAVNLTETSRVIAQHLADTEVTLESLSGDAAKLVKHAIGEQWISEGRYDPRRLVFNYRHVNDSGRQVKRIGTVVFWGGGGIRTKFEGS